MSIADIFLKKKEKKKMHYMTLNRQPFKKWLLQFVFHLQFSILKSKISEVEQVLTLKILFNKPSVSLPNKAVTYS